MKWSERVAETTAQRYAKDFPRLTDADLAQLRSFLRGLAMHKYKEFWQKRRWVVLGVPPVVSAAAFGVSVFTSAVVGVDVLAIVAGTTAAVGALTGALIEYLKLGHALDGAAYMKTRQLLREHAPGDPAATPTP